MTKSTNQQSNPFSTGGGGPNFETRIQAAFTVLLLTGRMTPCLPAWPITKIKLQGQYAGYDTDDFIVFVQDAQSQKGAKLLAQIKHDIAITEGDETFAKVIKAAWRDFNDANIFDSRIDSIALITGPLSDTDINNVRPLLEWARHCENETEFLQKVGTAHFSSEAKRKKLQVFKTHLSNANAGVEVSPKQLWEFLRSFYLLGYDLDAASGSTLSLIQSLIALYSSQSPLLLWSRILDAVQSANQNAGTITLETLPQDIRSSFSTNESLQWDSDLKKLNQHGEYIIDGIRTTIGGIHISRPRILAQLLDACESANFVLISGERGCGKSSLAQEFSAFIKDHAPVFCLRTEDLDKAHLDNVFSTIGLGGSISDVAAGFALMPKKYLLIESIEKLLELKNTAAFTDLLNFLNKNQGWTVIATGRDYAYQQIAFNHLQPSGLNHSTVVADRFDEQEVESLCEKLESLKAIANNPSLKALLHNPFLADLAYRVAASGTQFSGSDGEKEFRAAVWRDVIAKEQERVAGLPLKRRKVFVEIAVMRAKQMVYGVPELGFDAEALMVLEADSLIRRDVEKELVSPAHDVLEDWALERHIDDAYRQFSGDVSSFLDAVGQEPAMNRAFRLWLHQKLKYGDNINDLILSILNNQSVQKHWQDEAISAVLLGQNPYDFLQALKDKLLENDGNLLKRFCFILRIACTTPNQILSAQLSRENDRIPNGLDTLYLMPYGQGWQAIIRFLFENKDSLPIALVPHVIAVLYEWAASIHIEDKPSDSARKAGLLSLHILDGLKDLYRDEGDRKKILCIIIKTIPAIENEFNELLNADIFNPIDKLRHSYTEDLRKILLEEVWTTFVCKHVPETVIKLAFHEWFIDESKNKKRESHRFHTEVEECFGLHAFRNDFFPPSGARGPFQPLLRFHPRRGLDFILQLLNRAAEKYAHSDLDIPSRYKLIPTDTKNLRPEQLEIELDDGTLVKQYYSGRIWVAYRGHSVVPCLLQSALMALENWLIGLVENTDSQEILEWVFDYILRNSNSVMSTAVLASVATGFHQKLGKVALPLLWTPELYEMDMSRKISERRVNEMNWFASTYDSFADMYAEERRIAALRPWRREDLEFLVSRLQFSHLREEAFASIEPVCS